MPDSPGAGAELSIVHRAVAPREAPSTRRRSATRRTCAWPRARRSPAQPLSRQRLYEAHPDSAGDPSRHSYSSVSVCHLSTSLNAHKSVSSTLTNTVHNFAKLSRTYRIIAPVTSSAGREYHDERKIVHNLLRRFADWWKAAQGAEKRRLLSVFVNPYPDKGKVLDNHDH